MKYTLKTIGSIVAISAAMIMATSCTKDKFAEDNLKMIPGVERYIAMDVTFPQTQADKAFLDPNDNYSVKWVSGDGINVNGTILTTTNDNTTKAMFEGTVYANPSGGNEHYWAVYPASLAGTYSGGIPADFASTTSLTVHLPTTQTINTANSALAGNTYMAAHLSVTAGTQYLAFDMRNIGSILELDLTPNCSNITRVDSIVFTSSNASLAGTFTVSDASNPTVTPTSGTNKVVVTFQDGAYNYIDITGGKKVHVILPPLTSKNLNMKIYSNARYMEKKATSITLARNTYYSSAISFDVSAFAPSDVVGFSVSATKRVLFSPGNLQWSATNGGTVQTLHINADGTGGEGTFRFAEHQWDYVGDATNGNVYANSVKCDNALLSWNYTGWIDLFGWGTSGYHDASDSYNTNYSIYSSSNSIENTTYNYYGYGPSINMTDPNLIGTSAHYDWGVYNPIFNPKTGTTDPAGTWRTLTIDEWLYIINTREIIVNCNTEKMYGHANVNGVNGLVILPDNWNPASCSWFTYGNSSWANTIDETTNPKWSQMEALGCVFLPVTGTRNGTSVSGDQGYYWSTTCLDNSATKSMLFTNGNVNPGLSSLRNYGQSVRLVKDVH